MKKTIHLLLLATAFFAFTANAKEKTIPLEDNSAILGSWKLTAEAAAKHKTKTPLNIHWIFKADGMLNTFAKDSRNRTGSMNINIKYFIEDGAIKKQIRPGTEKYETCTVTDLDDKSMILHCKYLYYFMEKE